MRVILRPLEAADRAAFVAAAQASRSLHRPWVSPPCDDAAFDRHLARFNRVTDFAFVVQRADGDALVGVINLTGIIRGAFLSGYLGYYAFKEHQGQGLMHEGLTLAVRHAFGGLGLHRVEANIQPANGPSIALVRACGFSLEGYSPRYLKIGGRWRDHERWARVKGLPAAGR
jgi:ribosomal-protein-alanine N-acetyltransferase